MTNDERRTTNDDGEASARGDGTRANAPEGGGEGDEEAPAAEAREHRPVGVLHAEEAARGSVRVVNTGPVSGAVSVLALLSSEHSDAVTNSKLVDFAKTAILPPGGSELVRLVRAHYVLF